MNTSPQPFPSKVLMAAAAMIALTITAAATARWTGLGSIHEPQSAAAQSRELRFEDQPDGSISVYQAADGRLVETLAPGTDGFVRIVMRSLARERRLNDQGPDMPFRLIRWDDGRLSVADPATGRSIELSAFGSANARSFARLLSSGKSPP
jgi:putative photosynthetic complex assembly protein